MSDTDDKEETIAAGVPKRSGGGGIVGLILPALIAGGAAFGGAKMAAGRPAVASAQVEHAESKPPGPTAALNPFLISITDVNKKGHPMKMSLAIEFEASAKEESIKSFTPRLRDAALGYLRTIAYEDATDNSKSDKMRADLLERLRAAGVTSVERVLITDLVVQ